MKPADIARITWHNLWRRKARTLLTVIGVVIGCCSIVIMISIGIGMKQSQHDMLQSMGDLTIIQVSAPQTGKKIKLTDQSLGQMKALSSVVAVTPKVSLEVGQPVVYAGQDRRYLSETVQLVGMDPAVLEAFGYQLSEGSLSGQAKQAVLVGQYFEYQFQDKLRPPGYNMVERYPADEFMYDGGGLDKPPAEPPAAYFNAMKTTLSLEIETRDQQKHSLSLPVGGRVKQDLGKGFETADGIIVPLPLLESILRSAGQSANPKGGYDTALVKVSGIESVRQVERAIKAMGFQTHSMDSIRGPLEKEARQKQMMLGGLGAISLLVAAIGITNTMIMSISERTRKIGIMKALGCFVSDIRLIFLSEAGLIGLIGGIIGSGLSLAISFVMNLASAKGGLAMGETGLDMLAAEGAKISIIPLWLIGFAIVFSVLIGLGSGFYPANKAVRISALEAIRSE